MRSSSKFVKTRVFVSFQKKVPKRIFISRLCLFKINGGIPRCFPDLTFKCVSVPSCMHVSSILHVCMYTSFLAQDREIYSQALIQTKTGSGFWTLPPLMKIIKSFVLIQNTYINGFEQGLVKFVLPFFSKKVRF